MTLSNRIRAAALGPTPKPPALNMMSWVRSSHAWEAVYYLMDWRLYEWHDATETERRMFLLFVADALENP